MAQEQKVGRAILKPIRYHGPDKQWKGKLVRPGDVPAGLDFSHLTVGELALLERRKFLGPVVPAEKQPKGGND